TASSRSNFRNNRPTPHSGSAHRAPGRARFHKTCQNTGVSDNPDLPTRIDSPEHSPNPDKPTHSGQTHDTPRDRSSVHPKLQRDASHLDERGGDVLRVRVFLQM